jgi:hypothetical protein
MVQDIFNLIPEDIKRQALDAVVDFVSDQTKKFLLRAALLRKIFAG